jgi:hypothetical protein
MDIMEIDAQNQRAKIVQVGVENDKMQRELRDLSS